MKKEKTKLTSNIADYIKNNLNEEPEKISEKFDINQPIVEMVQEVQADSNLQKKGSGKKAITEKVEERKGIYTAKQASEYLPYSFPALSKKLNSGKVRGRMLDGIWIVREEDLREAIEEAENG